MYLIYNFFKPVLLLSKGRGVSSRLPARGLGMKCLGRTSWVAGTCAATSRQDGARRGGDRGRPPFRGRGRSRGWVRGRGDHRGGGRGSGGGHRMEEGEAAVYTTESVFSLAAYAECFNCFFSIFSKSNDFFVCAIYSY